MQCQVPILTRWNLIHISFPSFLPPYAPPSLSASPPSTLTHHLSSLCNFNFNFFLYYPTCHHLLLWVCTKCLVCACVTEPIYMYTCTTQSVRCACWWCMLFLHLHTLDTHSPSSTHTCTHTHTLVLGDNVFIGISIISYHDNHDNYMKGVMNINQYKIGSTLTYYHEIRNTSTMCGEDMLAAQNTTLK